MPENAPRSLEALPSHEVLYILQNVHVVSDACFRCFVITKVWSVKLDVITCPVKINVSNDSTTSNDGFRHSEIELRKLWQMSAHRRFLTRGLSLNFHAFKMKCID